MSLLVLISILLLAPIRHSGKDYNKDDELEVTEAQAKRLEALGVAKILGPAKKTELPKTTAPELPKNTEETGAGNSEKLDDKVDYDTINVHELKQELSLLGVDYKANTPKAELIELHKKAVEELEAKGDNG